MAGVPPQFLKKADAQDPPGSKVDVNPFFAKKKKKKGHPGVANAAAKRLAMLNNKKKS